MEATQKLKKNHMTDLENINVNVYDSAKHKKKIYDIYNSIDSGYISDSKEDDSTQEKPDFKIRFKTRMLIKIFFASLILFSCILTKLAFYQKAMSNKYIVSICNEYKKAYKKEDMLEFVEKAARNMHKTLYYAIPDKFAMYIKTHYFSNIKPSIQNFKLKESVKNVFFDDKKAQENQSKDKKGSDVKQDENMIKSEETGMGGGGPIESSISEQNQSNQSVQENESDQNVKEILSKNISIIHPTTGTITSRYGPREQIFEGVNPYHTGIDIANVLNTQIVSATTGKVVTLNQNDKYYGKMVEVETDGVIFKYGHMNEIKVQKDQDIKQGEIIGLMGKTGYATGSHLHFEIRINGTSVNPEKIIKF